MIGKTIGDYRIIEKRGEGGMGIFFKAQDIRLDHFVGIKTIRAELLNEPEIIAKLEEEAKSLARLDHQNIARLLHYMVIDGQRYIVMEYVEGVDLAEKLKHEGPLPLDQMALIVPQVCAAIGYAHNKKIIHRDIKPSNMLLATDNTVKVTDFGIAKILGVSTKTKTGIATGSLPYMAPEQIRGTGIDTRTDIYQLGVMFFELSTGRRPFLAETEYDMMSHHLSTPPPIPSSINPSIPKAVDLVVLRALAKDPAARQSSAAELADAFRNAIGGEDKSRTVYRIDRDPITAPTSAQKRRRLIGGVVIGILALLAFAKVFLFNKKDNKPTIGPLVEVAVHATIPTRFPAPSKVTERLTAEYLGSGSGRSIFTGDQRDLNPPSYDSITSATTQELRPGDDFSMILWMESADSARFRLLITEPTGEVICSGQTTQRLVGTNIAVEIPLAFSQPASNATVAPQERQPSDSGTIKRPIATGQRDNITPESPVRATTDNLTLDVQPFAERARVEAIWLDGKKVSGQLPLSLVAASGLRTIRWKIGNDYWTDTVTAGTEPVEKNLMFESSRGRANVTVSFPDGPGYASIWLDGQDTGQGTPGELRDIPAGPHEITLKRDGYRMKGGPFIVRVPANDRARISIPMTPQ